MKARTWLIGWMIIVLCGLGFTGFLVYKVDPFFHYHAPDTGRYYYKLNNQRSQNVGIIKNFDYDAIIIGTSMIENFKTSEMDELFGCKSVKLPYMGATFREINDNVRDALTVNPDIKIVVRGLDIGKFDLESDDMRDDLGDYPTYLYDKNPFNDVKYLFNRDVVFGRVYPMIKDHFNGFAPGITSFDEYSRWQDLYPFGIEAVHPEQIFTTWNGESEHLNDKDKAVIVKNITENVVSIAEEYPDVDFYYFYTPYSAIWWLDLYNSGRLERQLEAEKLVTELILPHDNIKLFSLNNRTDITTDINNYEDPDHYGEWVNSLILRSMYDGKYQLTRENYEQYIQEEKDFYLNFDYESLNGQVDYEDDYQAAEVLVD